MWQCEWDHYVSVDLHMKCLHSSMVSVIVWNADGAFVQIELCDENFLIFKNFIFRCGSPPVKSGI